MTKSCILNNGKMYYDGNPSLGTISQAIGYLNSYPNKSYHKINGSIFIRIMEEEKQTNTKKRKFFPFSVMNSTKSLFNSTSSSSSSNPSAPKIPQTRSLEFFSTPNKSPHLIMVGNISKIKKIEKNIQTFRNNFVMSRVEDTKIDILKIVTRSLGIKLQKNWTKNNYIDILRTPKYSKVLCEYHLV